jgi:hypothetical protein
MQRALLILVGLPLTTQGVDLKVEHVANARGNKANDDWGFWFELAHARGQFERLGTYSTSVPKAGIPKKVTGPIASMLPNPDQTEGWIFHRDWDGRFEGIWADKETNHVLAYPYVEKNAHMAVAITYRVAEDGDYDITGGLTDLQVQPQFKQHDGVEWIVEIADGGKPVRKIGSGGPIGDGGDRPDGGKFEYRKVSVKKGQLIRLVIHPRKWWGSDLTRIDSFRIEKK